jgi:hypothetical protein
LPDRLGRVRKIQCLLALLILEVKLLDPQIGRLIVKVCLAVDVPGAGYSFLRVRLRLLPLHGIVVLGVDQAGQARGDLRHGRQRRGHVLDVVPEAR